MLSYCLRRRRNTESKNSGITKPYKGKLFFLSKYAVCGSEKSRFINYPQAS